jgi:quercetin dioxygenase-like cupin family protein
MADILRERLLVGAVDAHVGRIEAHRVVLQPGQRTGVHVHPGGVFGCVLGGRVVLQVQGGPPTTLGPGGVFHEPRGATILRFDNDSAREPAEFIAFYPLTGDQPLISMR